MQDCFIKASKTQDTVKSKNYAFTGIAVVVAVTAIVIIFTQLDISQKNNNEREGTSALYLDFSYEEANSDLKTALASHHIDMFNPIRFSSQTDISQNCNFLSDPKKQALVKYCTS